MDASERTCALCGDPIDADQAWLQTVEPAVDEAERDRWMPPEA